MVALRVGAARHRAPRSDDRRNFYKVEKWSRQRIEEMLFAGNSL
jgi:hypothetical protein